MTGPWTLQLLGGIEARRGDAVVDRFRTQKAAALLAYLALRPGTPIPRERLVESLWPGVAPRLGRQSLSTELSVLRRQLERPKPPAGSASASVFVATRKTLKINPEALDTDVAIFERALEEAESAARTTTDPDARRRHLETAVAAYAGELCPGHFEEGILRERERLTRRFLGAADALSELARQRGDLTQAVEAAHRAVETDPLQESSRRALMAAYADQGAPHKALQQYRELESLLARELDAPPDDATRGLAESIAGAAGIDLDRLTASASPASSASSAAPATTATQEAEPRAPATSRFAPALTPLFGREEELGDLQARLADPDVRLLSITGPGGVGKTRLVGEPLRSLDAAGLAQTALFFSLADLDDPGLIPHALHSGLGLAGGVAEDADASVLDAVIVALANHECTLLVLDNLEQLLPGALPTLRSLLERLPTLRCVVTSRRRLVLQGEHTVVLRPLPVPPPTAGPDQLLTFASIRLFLDRARAAAPGFRLTEANAPLIAQLCTRLDGLPLALSIAGGWAHVLSPSQMITESMRRLSELKSRHRDAPERHRSLAAAISTSLDLLPSAVQRLFRRLGVFRGGFTLEAAEAVCDEALVLDGVAELIDASLLEAPPAQGGEIRFRMLDTVRSFAVEQLDPTEHAALRERLLAFLRGRIAAGDKLDAADKRAAWIDSLVPELGNLRQVLGWLIETRPEEGLGLTSALFPLWRMRALAEGRRWLGRALASASARSQPRCRTLREAASLAIHQGNLNEARELFQEAASIARDLGDLASLASVLGGLGLAAENLGDPGEARARYEESLALHRQVHGDRIATAAQANLARLLETEDELDAAQVHAEESYRLFSAQGSWRGAVAAQSNLGRIFHRRGEFEQAMTCYQSALERVRKVGDEVFLVDGLLLLASLLSDTAQFDAARAHLAEAQELSERLGFQTTRAEGLVLEGEIAWREGDHRRAVECARRGLALSPNPRHAEHGLLIIAGASRALGDGPANEARVHYQDLVGRAHERSPARPTSLVAACLEGLAGLLSNDRPGDAAVALGAATAIRASLGTPLAPADLPLLKADSAKLRGELGEPGYLAALQCGRELSASELWDRFLSPQR